MRTSKPISTISYNTADFLKAKLESWKRQGIIEFAMWIRHEPEEDEKKAHYHLFIRPARLVQTTDLEVDSIEIDEKNPQKPFKMIGFRVSNESDWLLYGIHDPVYLMQKGLEREFVYDISDVQSTCSDTFDDIVRHVSDNRKGSLEVRLFDFAERGFSWSEVVATGMIPLRHMSGAKIMYEALQWSKKWKNMVDNDGESDIIHNTDNI